MANVTVNISDELKRRMARLDYINWSAVIRSIIEKKLNDFALAEKLTRRSKFYAEDLKTLAEKVRIDYRKEGRRLLNETNR